LDLIRVLRLFGDTKAPRIGRDLLADLSVVFLSDDVDRVAVVPGFCFELPLAFFDGHFWREEVSRPTDAAVCPGDVLLFAEVFHYVGEDVVVLADFSDVNDGSPCEF